MNFNTKLKVVLMVYDITIIDCLEGIYFVPGLYDFKTSAKLNIHLPDIQ